MSFLITLHIFSGQPNPTWVLSDGLAEDLAERFAAAEALDAPITRGLGYQGFSILQTDPEAASEPAPFASDLSDGFAGAFVSGQQEMEEFLLWSAGGELDDELSQVVRNTISNMPETSISYDEEALSCPPNGGLSAPAFNPGYWNNNPTILRSNNCYNYANNRATNTFAQPGRANGNMYTALTCGSVGPAAQSDGLRRVPTFQASTPGWYSALVIWPGRDYHWYRQDNNGCWSHKPGQTHARNTDNSGRPISDPRSCDRGPYQNFCSFYVTNNGVSIR